MVGLLVVGLFLVYLDFHGARTQVTPTDIGGIMITGGATALKLLEATGGEGIELHREIEPGVPMGCMVGGDLDGLKIVTKAGGFGTFDVFNIGYEILKQDK